LSHGIGDVARPRIFKVDHDFPPIVRIACSIAATMLG
jgi:hypothetical protein